MHTRCTALPAYLVGVSLTPLAGVKEPHGAIDRKLFSTNFFRHLFTKMFYDARDSERNNYMYRPNSVYVLM